MSKTIKDKVCTKKSCKDCSKKEKNLNARLKLYEFDEKYADKSHLRDYDEDQYKEDEQLAREGLEDD